MLRSINHILLLLFLVFPLIHKGQNDAIHWFQTQSGLPTTFVKDIEQDNEGNILLATYLGLIKYDGKTFTTQTIKHGLPTTSVSGLVKDEQGNIWIRSLSNKLSIYKNGKITPIESYNNFILNRIGYNIYPISDKEIIVDYVMPFYSVKHKLTKGKWQKTITSDSLENRVPLRDPKDKSIICGYFDYSKYDNSKEIQFDFIKGKDFNTTSTKFDGILSKLSIKEHEYISLDNILFEYDKTGLVKLKYFENTILQIHKGINNTLWLTFKTGIVHINQNTFNPIDDLLLEKDNFYNFFEDIDGGKWLSTSNGFGYLPNTKYKTYTLDKNFTSSINDGIAINDTLLIGHSNGDVGYIIPFKDEKEKLIFTHSNLENPYSDNYVSDFGVLPNNNIIFTNSNTGIYEIDRKTLITKKLADYGASGVFVNEKKAYCALYNKGVLVIENNKQELLEISKVNGKQLEVECVFTNNKNEILLGCSSGLFKYSEKGINLVTGRKELKDRIVKYHQISNTQSAIFTCGSGIILCSDKDTIIIDKENGLASNCIGSVCTDIHGNMWVVGVEGVSKISINKNDIRDYKIETIYGSELRSYVNFSIACIKEDIYILGKRIAFKINTKEDLHSKSKIPFQIATCYLGPQKMDSKNIEFEFTKSEALTIAIKQINYTPDTYVNYYYRLKGYDNDWLKTKNENISYYKLPPGTYEFEAYAVFSHNNQKSNVQSIKINVLPRYWQQTWFKIVLLIIAIGLVAFIVVVIIKKRTKKIRKESDIKFKMAEMESKLLRSNMNPHFVFNSLNSIQNFISKEEKDKATFYLGQFSKLMRNVLDQSYNENVSLEHELEMIATYVELEQMRCNNSFEMSIKIDAGIDPGKIKIPSMILQPYIENAIVHGLGPLMERKGELKIGFTMHENDMLKCIIEDNGIGRENAKKIKEEKEMFHKSMGLSITSERLDFFKLNGQQEAKVNIVDLFDNNNNASGTKIEIFIPIINES